MPKKKIDPKTIEKAWAFYLEDQSPKSVADRLEAAGFPIHENTIRRWIKAGLPSRGFMAFEDRLAEIKGTADRILNDRTTERKKAKSKGKPVPQQLPPPTQIEIVTDPEGIRGVVDNFTAKYLADGLEAYQALVDRTVLHGHIGLERVMDCLMGVDPQDTKAMKDATTAYKNMVSGIRGAIESRASLRGMGAEAAPDAPDTILMEHFEGWTPDEHRAFREDGIWPASQGEPPAFLMSPAPEQPPMTSSAPDQQDQTVEADSDPGHEPDHQQDSAE